MSESYTLFLNTQNPINFTSISGTSNVQFYVDWNSFLPYEYKKFNVTATLKSITSTVGFSALVYVDLNFGSGTSFNQSTSQSSISISLNANSYSVGGATRNSYDTVKNSKGEFQINRPTDNNLNIKIINSGSAVGTIAAGFPHFTLKLKFKPVE